MGESNILNNRCWKIKSKANGQYTFFWEIWRYRDNWKELLLHVYISKPVY